MLEEFLKLASINTQNNLETCGVLTGYLVNLLDIYSESQFCLRPAYDSFGGLSRLTGVGPSAWCPHDVLCFQKKGAFNITTLIIPKQKSTSDSVRLCSELAARIFVFLLNLLTTVDNGHRMEARILRLSSVQHWCAFNGWNSLLVCIEFWDSVKLWMKKNCLTYKNSVDFSSLDGYMYALTFYFLLNLILILIYGGVILFSEKKNWFTLCVCFQTHPKQSCFMSSVDLHTHYSYQVSVPWLL